MAAIAEARVFLMSDGWDVRRLQLARGVFGIDNIQRIHDGLHDSSGVLYPDLLWFSTGWWFVQ